MALDVVAGTLGGVAGITACQPFDTVKVRLQTQLHSSQVKYGGAIDCARSIIRLEGFRAFYKGMVAPLISNAPINAIVFGAERTITRQLRKHRDTFGFDPVIQHMVAGAAAGLMQTFISAPAELIKVRLQVARGTSNPLYNGNIQCAKYLYKRGGIKGLYRGFWITACRDGPAFGMYFWTYDIVKMMFQRRHAEKLQVPVEHCPMLPSWQLMMSGGIAGTISWALFHPVDVIKSCVQALPDSMPEAERTVAAVCRAGYKREGWRFFFRGYVATLTRAFPNNAVCFLVYEWIVFHSSAYLCSEEEEVDAIHDEQ